jgi:hypothetical protein
MGLRINGKIAGLFNDPAAVKAIATTDKDGAVHVVYKGSFSINPEGNIQFYELNETSLNNKNLIYSLWFKRQIAINILSPDHTSYQIKGIPVRAIISGKEFENAYVSIQARLGADADISTIWVIKPTEIREETYSVRQKIERTKYPLIGHLDRFVKHEDRIP